MNLLFVKIVIGNNMKNTILIKMCIEEIDHANKYIEHSESKKTEWETENIETENNKTIHEV